VSPWAGKAALATRALAVGLLGVTTLAVWWTAGYFIVDGTADLQQTGFGRLSLNLAAPVIPPPGAWLTGRVGLAGLPHEELEGYSYLGLGGVLLLAAGAVAIARGRVRVPLARHAMLLLACLGLTLLAIGPTVRFGGRVLLEYDPAWWGPLTLFRSSGRVFWIVYYAALVAGIAAVVSTSARRVAVAVMAAAVTLQALDLAAPRRMSRQMRSAGDEWPLVSELWPIAPAYYRHMVLHPTNMCAVDPGIDYRHLSVVAGNAGSTINAGYAGRYDVSRLEAYCAELERVMATGEANDDTLYVVTPAEVPRVLGFHAPMACAAADAYAVCFTVASYQRWRDRWDIHGGRPAGR
jgi:hypothetical protein